METNRICGDCKVSFLRFDSGYFELETCSIFRDQTHGVWCPYKNCEMNGGLKYVLETY